MLNMFFVTHSVITARHKLQSRTFRLLNGPFKETGLTVRDLIQTKKAPRS
jgi:hypothetical protein